jgi:hypothetical protein
MIEHAVSYLRRLFATRRQYEDGPVSEPERAPLTVISVKVSDSTFPHVNAIGLAGENRQEHPALLRWDRSSGGYVRVWTDIRLDEAVGDPTHRKIALLIEPRGLSEAHYEKAWELRSHFDTILTYDRTLVEAGEPFKFYPVGGSWMHEWAVFSKNKEVGILVSEKRTTMGQTLRHAIVESFKGRIDVYGEPYTKYLSTKGIPLKRYRYSIIVESDRRDWYFTEKIVDCISQGTIPIYWGCPDIGRFFDTDGILAFKSIDELGDILKHCSTADYERRLPAVHWNLEAAREFRCAEDWIVGHYPGLLGL